MIFWSIVMAVVGLVLLVFGLTRFGINSIRQSIGSAGGLIMLLAICLLTGALGVGLVGLSHRDDRKKFDAALVQIFGRAPDKLDLEGDSMREFNGFAEYDKKRYRLEVKVIGMHDTAGGGTETNYNIIATPMDPPAPAATPATTAP